MTKTDQREWTAYVKSFEQAEEIKRNGALPEAVALAHSQAWSRYCTPVAEIADRLLERVQDHPDDPAAVEALTFVVMTTRNFASDQALRAVILLKHHILDENISQFTGKCFVLFYVPEAEQLLRAVLEQNPSRNERGRACNDLVYYLEWQAAQARRLRKSAEKIKDYAGPWRRGRIETFVREKDPEAIMKEAEALLDRCVSEFATVPGVGFLDGSMIGNVARGKLFEIQNLGLGKVAPEIQGADVEGRRFKLSEYRGKVVVLTFSGNWCGPCRELYLAERELIQRLKGRPFAVLSVNTDKVKETLRKSIRDGEITWRCWWDGGTGGPITTAWGVKTFPETYVLDGNGVIRLKQELGESLDREELDQAVKVLLDETAAAKP